MPREQAPVLFGRRMCLIGNCVLSWLHARWFERKRAEWIASNDQLIAALRKRDVTPSQEGDEVS